MADDEPSTTTASSAVPHLDNGEESLSSTLQKSIDLLPSSASTSIAHLRKLQERISTLSLFSTNESLDDVSTASLPLLSVEYHLGAAYLALPTTTAVERKEHVTKATELFHAYLKALESLGIMEDGTVKDYHAFLDLDHDDNEEAGGGGGGGPPPSRARNLVSASHAREIKIARFRRKKALADRSAQLSALQERRGRMGVDRAEEMDGYDGDGLEREVALGKLRLWCMESLEELDGGRKEMEMLKMAVQMERGREEMERHRGGGSGPQNRASIPQDSRQPRARPNQKPLQVTHITQNATTGELQFRKEEIRSQVFRPSWNQPTMTLQELGDMERAQAIERSEKQKAAEAEARSQPRRYEQLVRDGMEDDAELVDASAKLDREWDAFKDENPRGSGNKMGDRGDRNF